MVGKIKIGGLYKQKPNPNQTWCCGHFNINKPLIPVFEKLSANYINAYLENHFKLKDSVLHVLMLVTKQNLEETGRPFQLSKYDIGCYILSYINGSNKPAYCRLDQYLINDKKYCNYTFLDEWELIS